MDLEIGDAARHEVAAQMVGLFIQVDRMAPEAAYTGGFHAGHAAAGDGDLLPDGGRGDGIVHLAAAGRVDGARQGTGLGDTRDAAFLAGQAGADLGL